MKIVGLFNLHIMPWVIGATALPVFALEQPSALLKESNQGLLLLVIALLVIQSLLIIGLQKNRIRHKRAKAELAKTHKELEQRVIDRTRQLESINKELYREISNHEKTEALLLRTQDYLHSILNSMPSILMGVTSDGEITHWNAAAEADTGLSAAAALGMPLAKAYPTLHISEQDIKDATASRIPIVSQNLQQGRGNQARYFDLTIYPLVHGHNQTNAVIRIDDVTPRIHMENMLIQNEKMLSLGELAAGLAHEINNPLAAILNGLQNLERRTSANLQKNHDVAESLGFSIQQLQDYFTERDIYQFTSSIRLAGEQAAKIVTNMLEFSRGNGQQFRYENINNLVKHALDMAENMMIIRTRNSVNRISVSAELAENLPSIPCSASELQQVLLNLIRNASQAFPPERNAVNNEPRHIWVRTFVTEDYLCIQVEDNGVGITDSVKEHIFEPFFTTKEVGDGTGLGLSVSYFIVAEHHSGEIAVDSQLGKGTVFTIKLPINAGD